MRRLHRRITFDCHSAGATDWRKQPDNASPEREFDDMAVKVGYGESGTAGKPVRTIVEGVAP
jgi:hypothetical protein